MTDTNEPKAVRDARARARRLSRTTPELSYQQALDGVARSEGYAHWSAFMKDDVHARGTGTAPPSSWRRTPFRRFEEETRPSGHWDGDRVTFNVANALTVLITLLPSPLLFMLAMGMEKSIVSRTIMLVMTTTVVAGGGGVAVFLCTHAMRGTMLWLRTRRRGTA